MIDSIATEYGLPPKLVRAIVQVESGGNAQAMRVEPHYKWLWNISTNKPYTISQLLTPPYDFPSPRGASPSTEFWGQKTSWGLMQVMGAVAREQGFYGPYLSALCEPEEGVRAGCMHLLNLHRRYGKRYGMEGVVAAYNAGSVRLIGGQYANQVYVDRVRLAGGFGNSSTE